MGFRFRRTIRIMPGVRLNVGKRGVSASVGVRGAHVTVGATGIRKTVGVPGTGMSWTSFEPNRPELIARPVDRQDLKQASARRRGGTLGALLILLAFGFIVYCIAHF